MLIEGKVNVEYVGSCENGAGGVEISKDGVVLQSVYDHVPVEITFSPEARVIATEALQKLGGYDDIVFSCDRLIIPKNIEKIAMLEKYSVSDKVKEIVRELASKPKLGVSAVVSSNFMVVPIELLLE